MAGCQSFATASSAVRLRVIDLSPDAGPVDIYQGNHAIAYNLTYGSVTSYVSVAAGPVTTTIVAAGARQPLSTATGTFTAGAQYTLLLNSSVASLHQTILADQPPSGPSDPPALRLIHQADRTGPLDVYLVPAGQRLASIRPVATNLAPGAATGYLPVPPGTYTTVLLPAGAPRAASQALHTGRQVEYANGSAHTLILLDAAPTLAHRLEVIETADADTETSFFRRCSASSSTTSNLVSASMS